MNVMDIGVRCGFIVGIVIGILLVIFLLRATKTDKSKKYRFDERQELTRGRGFKYGFFTMLICNLLFVCMAIAEIPLFAEFEMLVIINSFLGIGIWLVYCIWNESYFALNEDKRWVMILFAVIAVMNFISGGYFVACGKAIQNGKLTYHSLNLFCGALFIIVFLTMFLKRICKDRKDEQE